MKHLRTFVIDRYEGTYAILEDNRGRIYDVLRDEMPANAREGDILTEDEGIYVIDEKATEVKRAKVQKISDALTKHE
jgi:hypothetical protein